MVVVVVVVVASPCRQRQWPRSLVRATVSGLAGRHEERREDKLFSPGRKYRRILSWVRSKSRLQRTGHTGPLAQRLEASTKQVLEKPESPGCERSDCARVLPWSALCLCGWSWPFNLAISRRSPPHWGVWPGRGGDQGSSRNTLPAEICLGGPWPRAPCS